MNERFQNALKRIAQDVPPIWMMRQAGRYHSHYKKLRSQHSFMELCKEPSLAAQVALGPIQDFDFDVAILFSDLLFPLQALGMGLEYTDSGPALGWQLTREALGQLRSPSEALADLQFQKLALQETRKILPRHKSLIGFVGGPWTLFTYAVEGAHKGHLIQAKRSLGLYRDFCERLLPLLKANIQLQLEGGAEVVMIFDTAAGELSPDLFQEGIAPQLEDLASSFPQAVAYYSKGTTSDHLRNLTTRFPWAGFGVDHRFAMADLLRNTRNGFCQGNFDQTLLFLEREDFAKELARFLRPLRKLAPEMRAGWICGLGHGVLPLTPEAHVRLFVETVRREFSQ